MIVTALALSMGACTIHRHYHQAPAGPQAAADSTYAQAPGTQAPSDYSDEEPGDQPIPPAYARPEYRAPAPSYDARDYDDGYRYESRYSTSHNERRCDCEHVHQRRRPATRRSRGYRIHPGPVVPDNPVEWLE